MRTQEGLIITYRQAGLLATIATFILALTAVHGATMSASTNAPSVTGYDIANYGTVTGTDKWWPGTGGAGAAKGQTFTNGSTALLLKAITYQVTASQKAEPTKTYVIRVGTVSGTSFTQVYSEIATQTFTWNGGEYMTWNLAAPVLLSTNKTYGVDVGLTSSTSAWQTGIPYINLTANGYAGGQLYNSGTGYGVGTNTVTLTAGSDRIFHLRLQHPMAPSPEVGTTVGGTNITLSWYNLTPSVGSNVWVDVWFGTNSLALTKIVSAGLNTTSVVVNLSGAATYYWRVDSYLNGVATGSPTTGTRFYFYVADSDGDGMPDAWELAHGLNPNDPADAVLDPDSDGLTNLQEYQLGTDPQNPDTDGDGLRDGDEVTIYHTNPAKADTDADGLSDGQEINLYHTDPLQADTDGDGLSDGEEINIYHTNPLLADTDGDGVGDWYEVMAAYTDPNSPGSKPTIPYPLPKPNGSTGVTNKPVKVFILSGQSNMVGLGNVAGTDGTGAPLPGTLQTIVKQQGKFPDLLDISGNWAVRSNVWYKGVITATAAGPLQPGQGAGSGNLGPELGFGRVMGYYLNEPVLLIKASQGNRGLFWDISPPGSLEITNSGTVYAGYGESPNSWPVGGGPTPFVWYAGKQYDDFFLAESDMGAPSWANATAYPASCQVYNNGNTYISKTNHTSSALSAPGVGAQSATYWSVYSVVNVTDVLDNFATQYPQWAAQGFEIAGFAWFQGHWDSQNPLYSSHYETNLVNLIKTVRQYYENRYPGKIQHNAPFVVATIGFDGWGMTNDAAYAKYLPVANAQLAVGDPVKHPEFAGNVKTMESRGYWRSAAISPSNVDYHYNLNAETYMLVGDALGRGMIDLLNAGTANDYATWASNFSGTNLTDPNADYDGDGMSNDAERLFGLNPTSGASGNPVSFNTGLSAGTFTYTRRTPALTGYNYTVWTSTNLVTWTQDLGAAQTPGVPVADVETVMVTLSPALLNGPQLFVKMRATP